VSFLKENGEDLYREDISEVEIKSLMNSDPEDKFIHIWREFENSEKPYSWRVWPHSKTKDWLERIEQKINYE
jgi:hypothetical protein